MKHEDDLMKYEDDLTRTKVQYRISFKQLRYENKNSDF